MSTAAPQSVTAAVGPLSTVPPNAYHLTGDGITVAYFPDGSGPPRPDGRIHMVYQDAAGTLTFTDSEVRVVDVQDLGEIASVTIRPEIDTGMTTFSLLIPTVALPTPASAASITTEGITTVYRGGVLVLGRPQRETYVVTALVGEASRVELPDGEALPDSTLPLVSVPDIVTMYVPQAREAVEDAGLKLGTGGKGNEVLWQRPVAGRNVPRGSGVYAFLWTEPDR